MPTKPAIDIQIIHIKHSEQKDHSLNYLIDFKFKANNKLFHHTDYLDSHNRTTVKKLTANSQIPIVNLRLQLMIELEVNLRITDTQAEQLFYNVLHTVDEFIAKLQNNSQLFPTLGALITTALKNGFWLVAQSSDLIHLMKANWKHDQELHIYATSIHFLIDELVDYIAGDGVTESYSYRNIVQRNSDQTGFSIAVNPFGNGWLIENWHQRPDLFPTDHLVTLKELSERISYLIANKDAIS